MPFIIIQLNGTDFGFQGLAASEPRLDILIENIGKDRCLVIRCGTGGQALCIARFYIIIVIRFDALGCN